MTDKEKLIEAQDKIIELQKKIIELQDTNQYLRKQLQQKNSYTIPTSITVDPKAPINVSPRISWDTNTTITNTIDSSKKMKITPNGNIAITEC